MVYDRSFLLTMCHVCFAAVSLLDVDNKHATLWWKFLFTWSLSADAYWLNVWFNVKPNVPKCVCVCVHESVLKCGRVIWVLCVWTCWLFCTCICVRLSAHMCLEKWVFVCGSLSLCLCVCMCFAHSKPIFIHPAISKVVHLLVGRFRQGQDERVEKLMFSGDSVCLAEAAPVLLTVYVKLLGECFSFLFCIASRRDWTSWAITAHRPSHTC